MKVKVKDCQALYFTQTTSLMKKSVPCVDMQTNMNSKVNAFPLLLCPIFDDIFRTFPSQNKMK